MLAGEGLERATAEEALVSALQIDMHAVWWRGPSKSPGQMKVAETAGVATAEEAPQRLMTRHALSGSQEIGQHACCVSSSPPR